LPQNMQARCGRIGWWHEGHSVTPFTFKWSCDRRMDVRRFEWRRFGLGMVADLSLSLLLC